MDQLTAYRILQLMPGSTRREIREAYARLAKEYHPEEHPKEFNQIQEAYQLLTGRGENWSSDAVDDWFSDGEKTESEWESEETCESDTRWKEEEEQETTHHFANTGIGRHLVIPVNRCKDLSTANIITDRRT